MLILTELSFTELLFICALRQEISGPFQRYFKGKVHLIYHLIFEKHAIGLHMSASRTVRTKIGHNCVSKSLCKKNFHVVVGEAVLIQVSKYNYLLSKYLLLRHITYVVPKLLVHSSLGKLTTLNTFKTEQKFLKELFT